MPVVTSSRPRFVPPPLVALKNLEQAACRDLTVARLTLGLFDAIVGGEPSFLFPGYRWRLCEVKSFPPKLAGNAAQIMVWGARRGAVLNSLLASRANITRAVLALRRQSPHGRHRVVLANRWRREYPQIKPSVGKSAADVQPLRAVDILHDEVGRPLSDGTIRLMRALQPSRIEILAHDEGEYCSWHAGAIKIRLAQDGYTVTAITLVLAVEAGKRLRKIHGVLEDFFETGTEGVIWSVVSEDDHGYDALYPIEEGDHLTIQDQLGRKMWSGKIRCDRRAGWRRYPLNPKYGQPCALGHWVHWTQRGFKPDDWARYFIRPEYDRLRGILRKKQS